MIDEITRIKIELLKGMDEYIKKLGDKEATECWYMQCISEKPTDDYLYFIATDDSLWRDICASFGKIVEIWGE